MNWPMIVAFGGWLICALMFPLGFYMGSKSKEREMTKRLQNVADQFTKPSRTEPKDYPSLRVMN